MMDKLKKYFGDMAVYKSSRQSRLFQTLSIPSFMRDWLVMKFSDEDGNINNDEVIDYVKHTVPKKEDWEKIKLELTYNGESVRFLAKVRVEIDIASNTAYFSLPDFGVPQKKAEATADWRVVEEYKEYLLGTNAVWGIVELICERKSLKDEKNILKLVDFVPFCPYETDLDYYAENRKYFSTQEWIDVLLSAADYNPSGYMSERQKLAMLKRLLPFAEKRLNLIELAPKGTGKSYIFSQISKYGWLVSGGSVSRAKMFYDISRNKTGLVSQYDYVALDEIQSITFPDKTEMQGALKGYLESPTGEYRVGDKRGVGGAGLVLLGNIKEENMDTNCNMFAELPDIFHESALIDRFHGFIKGWEIPRMRENLKAEGFALNSEYFTEIIHLLREESVYRAVVDELLDVPKNADTRDTEAIKRICTGFLKLLFPHMRSAKQVNKEEFVRYCLEPAKEMRGIIKNQLGIIDTEFLGKDIPDIRVL